VTLQELSVERISRSKKETGYLDRTKLVLGMRLRGRGGSVTSEYFTEYIEYLDYLATE